jgi:TolB-like protein
MPQQRPRRRLAAVLAADVVGYSRLMELDEAGTLDGLKSRRENVLLPLLAEYDGRLVKEMGDGVLVAFESAIHAVECAIALQAGYADANAALVEDRWILLRIGINVGDVVVEGGDLFGDAVNIAARLEALAEPGGIWVSRAVRDQVRDRLAVRLVDMGDQQVKNITRPIRCFRVDADSPAARLAHKSTTLHAIPRLSIVVLPFTNLGGDPEQGYFADGLTEDVTTDLSRIPGSFVIACSTAFTYRGQPKNAKRIARELGVRFVLEGSVRRIGNAARVNAQLIEGETGAHLWAERFEQPVSELASFQDQVTRRIAQSLSIELIDAESRIAKSARPDNPDAIDLAMQGWSFLNQPTNGQQLGEAQRLFEASLNLDKRLTSALLGLASVFMTRADIGWTEDPEADANRAEKLVNEVLRLDSRIAAAHRIRSMVLAFRHQLPQAVSAVEEAIALNRNDSVAHRLLALLELQSGRPERSRIMIEQTMRLSPRDPYRWAFFTILGRAQVALDECDSALLNFRQALSLNPAMTFITTWIATALGRMGRTEEARAAISELLRSRPDLKATRSEAEQTVVDAQVELAVRGYYLGMVDGRIGPFCQRALIEFQRDRRLPQTGEMDAGTLALLGLKPP